MRKYSLVIICLVTGFIKALPAFAQFRSDTANESGSKVIPYTLTDSLMMPNGKRISFQCLDTSANFYQLLRLPDNDIQQNNIFFLGIAEGVKLNDYLDLLFIKYLHSKTNIKNILIEYGESTAWLINQYLTSGNEKYLINVVNGSKDYLHFFRQLYDYNNTLPQNQKIEYWGVDFERTKATKDMMQYMFVKTAHLPATLIPFINNMKEISSNDRTAYQFLKNSRKAFYKNEALLKNNLTNIDFEALKLVIENDARLDRMNKRNKRMYENFIKIDSPMPEGTKVFGLFGCTHTVLNNGIAFASKVNHSTVAAFRNKVLSFNVHYANTFSNYYGIKPINKSYIEFCFGYSKNNKEVQEQINKIKFSFSNLSNCPIKLIKVPDEKLFEPILRSSQYIIYATGQVPEE